MSKKNYKVKSVIFDMDGVITNTMPDHYRAWSKAFRDEGVHVTRYDVYSREGQRGMQSVEEMFAKYNKEFDMKAANRILKRKEEYFKKTATRKFIVGTRTLLKDLYRNNVTLALVTGTSHHELLKILPENLQNLFSVIVTGCQVKNGKPHPEPFLKSLQNLNIKAKDAVVLENAPFGVASAKAAKLKCLAIATSLPKKYLSQADQVFANIKELRNNVSFLKV